MLFCQVGKIGAALDFVFERLTFLFCINQYVACRCFAHANCPGNDKKSLHYPGKGSEFGAKLITRYLIHSEPESSGNAKN